MKLALTALAGLMIAAAPAHAAQPVFFADDFDDYSASQVPWNGDGGWTTGGTTDLVKSGEYSLTCAGGSGNCVDLTGNQPGTISHEIFLPGPGNYALRFLYTGNQLNNDGSGPYPKIGFTASIAGTSFHVGPLANDNANFLSFVRGFTATGPTTLTFTQDQGGNQFRGSIIDSVSVTGVPEPTTWAMMILGIGMIGAFMRRARKTLTGTRAFA